MFAPHPGCVDYAGSGTPRKIRNDRARNLVVADRRSDDKAAGVDPMAGLRRAVGQEVVFEGARCRVHDLVDEPAILVLKRLEDPGTVQADTFGKPARRAPGFIEIPVFSDDGSGPSEALKRVSFPGPRGTR